MLASQNIAEESPDVVGKSQWSNVFRRHLPFLLDHIDPDFGLLPKLVSNEILSYEQRDTVEAKETVNKRNCELLEIIRSENKWDGLIHALKISQQTHVVNYLEADGKHSSDEDWPLGEPEEKILRVNLDQLIELIEGKELIVELFSAGVINRSQLDFIEGKQTSSKKNEAFLNILRRRSIRDYNITIYYLKKTKQFHIALLLEKGGGIVRLHVNTDADPGVEVYIAAKIKNMLANHSYEEQCRIISLVGFDVNVIAATHGHSVVLYVYLQTLKQMIQLKESFQYGNIKDKVQLFFNTITSTSEHVVVLSVTVGKDEFSHVEDSLRDPHERSLTRETNTTDEHKNDNKIGLLSTSIDELPSELLDIILHKCYLVGAMQRDPEGHVPNKTIIARYASVNYCWFRKLTKRQSKRLIWRKLFELYRNQSQELFIVRNNSLYFESSLQSLNKIRYLKFSDCITDIQAACLQRQKRKILTDKRKKNNLNHAYELLLIVKSLDRDRYSSFIRCLRQTGKQKISSAAANGGATIQMICWKTTNAKSQISDVIGEMRKQLKETESQDVIQPTHTPRGLEMEIKDVHFYKANMYVCWVWCRSTKGLENLKETAVSKTIFKENFKTVVDNESFNKTMGFRSEIDSDWPLMDTQLKILTENQDSVVDCIVMDKLISNLYERKVINQWQKELINSKPDSQEKNETFLDILRRLSKKDFAITIDCLRESNQQYAAEILEERVGLATLIWHQKFLQETIDPDFELLGEEIQPIESEPAHDKRIAKLLKSITDEEKCTSFIDSLMNSGQTHVVNFLRGYGKFRLEFSNNWPLKERQKQILHDNKGALIELIEINELLEKLHARLVINRRQQELISTQSGRPKKNEAFLDILQRRSQEHFKQTIRCLHEARQSHVADILEKGTGRQLLVKNLPHDADEENIMLYFESTRFCPDGGDVDEVKLLANHEAVVTFLESDVVDRLVNQKLVMDGSVLYLSKLETCRVEYKVNTPGLTIEDFTKKDSAGEEIIESLEMKYNCVVEVSEEETVSRNAVADEKPEAKGTSLWDLVSSAGAAVAKSALNIAFGDSKDSETTEDLTESKTVKDSQSAGIAKNIKIQCGNLVDFQADVLVNPIASKTRSLEKAGAVSKSFHGKGKEALQEKFSAAGPPEHFGSITATDNVGNVFPCKKIYHVSIRRYRDSKSVELLEKLLSSCIKKAEQESMTSIAFPTIGCGKLSYHPQDVMKCFNKAAQSSNLQIYIIGFEQSICDTLSSCRKPPVPIKSKKETSKAATTEKAKVTRLEASTSTTVIRKAIVFRITALNNDVATTARNALAKKLSDAVEDVKLKNEAVAAFSKDVFEEIQNISSASKVHIEVDPLSRTIRLQGLRGPLKETKKRIDKLLAEEDAKQSDLKYIKATKGPSVYLARLAAKEDMGVPEYWKHYKTFDEHCQGSKRTPVSPGTELYLAIEKMVMGTWDSGMVGKGNDAKSLQHSTIVIKNIYVLEYLTKYREYVSLLKNCCYKASKKDFKRVNGLKGEAEVTTRTLSGTSYLYDQLVSEVNEYYLLHGSSHVNEIEKSGIDFRFSSERVLFGRGAYFAEKSIKADQYADPKDKRKQNGETLYMFVARVLLGEPFVCQNPVSYKKPPCAECSSESCHVHYQSCDSVIGTHKDASTRLLFREFIVYHMDQAYPEFLVEYVRQ